MLPFRRKQDEAGVAAPVETITRKPDDGGDGLDMLDAVADDLLMAIEKKDKKLLRSALEALCDHVQDMDSAQDQLTAGDQG